MHISPQVQRLIDVSAPLWGGEAHIFRTYWSWSGRSRKTDQRWLAYQCYKELWGSGVADETLGLFLGPLEEMKSLFPRLDRGVSRHEMLNIAQGFLDEFAHYCAFADLHDALTSPGEPKLDPHSLYSWPEDDALAKLRYRHREEFGELGMRAARFTEGGYGTLYSEAMKLSGHGGHDGLIAAACARVYEDEFDHMLRGVVGLDEAGLSEQDWRDLEDMIVAQLRHRIPMRNAQFSRPLGEAELSRIRAGEFEPAAFDYARAGRFLRGAKTPSHQNVAAE